MFTDHLICTCRCGCQQKAHIDQDYGMCPRCITLAYVPATAEHGPSDSSPCPFCSGKMGAPGLNGCVARHTDLVNTK